MDMQCRLQAKLKPRGVRDVIPPIALAIMAGRPQRAEPFRSIVFPVAVPIPPA